MRPAALALAALSALTLATLPVPALSQAAQGGTRGVDCDKPRYNAQGKLILDFSDGARQAICEAHRTTALTYANAVMETANRLRRALRTLPPPVWEDLVGHLRTDDDVTDWTYADAAAMQRLLNLSTAAPTTPGADGTTPSSAAHGVATHWQGGILARSGIGADWHASVQARACGFDANDDPVNGAVVLVWLDPDAVRDSWTRRMVQRTALAWQERQGDRATALGKVPHVLTAANTMTDARGSALQVSGDAAIQACLSTVPVGALVARVFLNQPRRGGERALRCEDPAEIGSRTFVWERRNGVYMVPPFAVLADGSDHPDRGEPLLGQRPDLPLVATEPDPTSTVPQPGEFLRLGSSCRPPLWRDAVRPQDCPAIVGSVADHDHATPHGFTDAESHGLRRHSHVTGTHVRRFRFRETQDDPVDPFLVNWEPVMPDPLDPDNDLGVIAPIGSPHPEWASVTVFCDSIPPSDAPPVPPRVEVPAGDPDWTVPDCATQWPGRFERGERTGYRQNFDYPTEWNTSGVKRDEEIRTIDDDCFNPVAASGQERRDGPDCPVGHVGEIIEGRDFSWWNRDWAVPSRHAGGTEGDRSVGQAAAAYDANPSQSGLEWWDVVTLVTDWRVVSNTCAEPSDDDDDDGGNGGNTPVSGPRDHPGLSNHPDDEKHAMGNK